jgi:hypothetical protein
MTGDKNDGQRRERHEFPLQFQAAQSGHAEIQHHTTGKFPATAAFEKFAGGGKRFDGVTGRLQETRQGFANGSIVVNHRNN